MTQEVRYERLRPRQIREKREACPVVYIPIGTIEWHGFHNPVGLDTLKIHQLCIRAAQAGGGLVFPPLWYGESREEALMEANSEDRGRIAEAMGLPPSNFDPGYMRRSPAEQIDNYIKLLVHVLNQARSLGFQVLVLGAGHYPLIDHARAAASLYHQQRWGAKRFETIPWVFTGFELVADEFEHPGDHAALWETSLQMALDNEDGVVDLSEMDGTPDKMPLGVGGAHHPKDASAEYGEKAAQAIVRKVVAEVKDRLENPGRYMGHGLRL